jgi:hypothetical protein
VNDADIKTLINSAVDGELAGHRTPPAWDRATLLERPGPARSAPDPARSAPTRRAAAWTVPVLAASAAALLAAGSIVAINHSRDNRSNQVGPASPAPSVSLSESVSTNRDKAAREYSEAVAAAAPDPSKLAGVSISAISAADAARLKNSGALRADSSSIANPQPGKTYSFTMSYLSGPGESTAVVSIDVRDVASGSCPPPFLTRAAHTYRVRCQLEFLASAIGKAALTVRTPAGIASAEVNLSDPAKHPASPSISPEEEQAAREYSDALTSAPEARTVAGVSDQWASAEHLRSGAEGVGSLDTPVPAPEPGRSYPVTLIYTPAADAPAIAVLAIRFEDVTTGRCPRAFRARRAHTYVIHCQVTFRPGAVGKAYYTLIEPHDTRTIGKTISHP